MLSITVTNQAGTVFNNQGVFFFHWPAMVEGIHGVACFPPFQCLKLLKWNAYPLQVGKEVGLIAFT